jgi:hypothetical protein
LTNTVGAVLDAALEITCDPLDNRAKSQGGDTRLAIG